MGAVLTDRGVLLPTRIIEEQSGPAIEVSGISAVKSPSGPAVPDRHDEHGVDTFIWPPADTSTWPPVGTFSWPRTPVGREALCVKATYCQGIHNLAFAEWPEARPPANG
jgi:hypothetical protein